MSKTKISSHDNTIILTCPTCPPHAFQDGRYGGQRRVANRLRQATDQISSYRCTICLKTLQR